jgi:hypothetical protein
MAQLTNNDCQLLGTLTTHTDSGEHFTAIYDELWLAEMEELGMIEITRPVHPTGIPYGQQDWLVKVTSAGEMAADMKKFCQCDVTGTDVHRYIED